MRRMFVAMALLAVGCADDTDGDGDGLFPDIVAVDVSAALEGWRFEVTMSSPYDSASRYADAWRVVGPAGEVYGVRELLHDHAAEQPFTRSLDGVGIPPAVTEVTVEGRDQRNGWGGATVTVNLPPLPPGT